MRATSRSRWTAGATSRYGLARPLSDADQRHLTRIGLIGRISVYREVGPEAPDVLYVAVRPGEFQPYQGFGPTPCR